MGIGVTRNVKPDQPTRTAGENTANVTEPTDASRREPATRQATDLLHTLRQLLSAENFRPQLHGLRMGLVDPFSVWLLAKNFRAIYKGAVRTLVAVSSPGTERRI